MIRTHEQTLTNGATIGWLTLDLPQKLNALTLEMASDALEQLTAWAKRSDIACVILQGEGRAFCAGGDVRRMRQGILDHSNYCEQFFEQEYRLDYLLHRYPKPVLAWGQGIVMGGGLGLFMGASHRVVTPSTRMAMPEVSIGLYPDVGASFFLNQLPLGLGLFLGITGCEWNAADAIALGMAQHLLTEEAHELLPAALATVHWSTEASQNAELLTAALQQLPTAHINPQLTRESERIRAACSQGALPAILALQQLDIDVPWFAAALNNLRQGCPVSMRIVEEQLRRGAELSLADVFRMEWCLSVQCCRHLDFPEGVRARLVDKDKQPHWQFASVQGIPDSYIIQHFAQPTTHHPLAHLT